MGCWGYHPFWWVDGCILAYTPALTARAASKHLCSNLESFQSNLESFQSNPTPPHRTTLSLTTSSFTFTALHRPQVWYAVSPAHRKRFERMAATAFPALARDCPAFLRHKDILISPSLLRANSIPYVQAKQMPGGWVRV